METAVAVELTVVLMVRDADAAAAIAEVLGDEYDVIETEMEEV
jgi:hypothetical protein